MAKEVILKTPNRVPFPVGQKVYMPDADGLMWVAPEDVATLRSLSCVPVEDDASTTGIPAAPKRGVRGGQ